MSDQNLRKKLDTIPKIYKPEFNPVMYALILALAQSDDEIQTQIANAKDQNFVRTAVGPNLERVANSLGVSKPQTLGLSDADFQELIPNLSLKPKQIKKAFYDTADVFWGPLFSRANVTSLNSAPFNVSTGDAITVKINGRAAQTVKVLAADIATDGAATAAEIAAILNRINGATASISVDALTDEERVNLRTDAPGSVGSVEILSSSMIGSSKLDFTIGEVNILDLPQRVSVYNLASKELLIEIPAIVPSLRRTLRGSHHFHEDSTLEPPVAPANVSWAGSFLYNPDGSGGAFTLTSQVMTLQQVINKGDVKVSLTVDDTSGVVESSGFLIMNFGRTNQEVPVRYRAVPNSNTILIDPGYIFKFSHSVGEKINVVSSLDPYAPRKDGSDLAIYFTSPSGARQIVQDILDTLKAAGIVVRFLVLAPKYKYILDNPYILDDDAPSA